MSKSSNKTSRSIGKSKNIDSNPRRSLSRTMTVGRLTNQRKSPERKSPERSPKRSLDRFGSRASPAKSTRRSPERKPRISNIVDVPRSKQTSTREPFNRTRNNKQSFVKSDFVARSIDIILEKYSFFMSTNQQLNVSFELEIRFDNFKLRNKQFNQEINMITDWGVYYRLQKIIRSDILQKYPNSWRNKIETTRTIDYSIKNFRHSLNVKTNTYTSMIKKRLLYYDDPLYHTRTSLSKEIASDKPPIRREPREWSFKREKIRHKFILDADANGNPIFQVDLTYVRSTSVEDIEEVKHSFEIELEFANQYNPTKVEYINARDYVLSIIQNSILLYSIDEAKRITRYVNNRLNEYDNMMDFIDLNFQSAQARNLHFEDLKFDSMINGNRVSVSDKVDGDRKLLIITEKEIWLLGPNQSRIKVFTSSNSEPLPFAGYIFDTEMVTHPNNINLKQNYWIVLFDCLFTPHDKTKIQQKPHKERLMYCNKLIEQYINNNIVRITTKKFYDINNINDFYKYTNKLLSSSKKKEYHTDGLIFTPVTVYNSFANKKFKNRLRERTLKVIPDICKWKPKETMTIDLKIVYGDLPEFNKLLASIPQHKSRDPTHFVQKTEIDFFQDDRTKRIYPITNSDIEYDNKILRGIPEGAIVEWEWNFDRKMLLPKLLRDNKAFPNNFDSALDNWNLVHNPINETTIMGNDFTLLRKYHNQIKKELLQIASFQGSLGRKYLIDIGSGKGGDVTKWKNYDRILAVEPNPRMHEELHRRIQAAGMGDKVKVLKTYGEDLKTIYAESKTFFKTKASCISGLFSLTFFSGDKLKELMNMVKKCISKKGIFIFATLDKRNINEFYENKNDSLQKINTAELDYNKKENVLSLIIHGSNTVDEKQIETPTDVKLLEEKFRDIDFELNQYERANKEKFLNDGEIQMTNLYSYGYFSNRNKITRMTDISNDDNVINLKNGYCIVKCIEDKNSMLHCLLKAINTDYSRNMENRLELADKFREELSYMLDFPYSRTVQDTNYDVYLSDAFLTHRKAVRYFESEQSIRIDLITYIADMINIDVIIIEFDSENENRIESVTKSFTDEEGNNKLTIIMSMQNVGEYEMYSLLGKYERDGKIQVRFFAGDFEKFEALSE